MFKKYTNGKREIEVTEKAYEVIYKSQGFKLVEEEKLESNNEAEREEKADIEETEENEEKPEEQEQTSKKRTSKK